MSISTLNVLRLALSKAPCFTRCSSRLLSTPCIRLDEQINTNKFINKQTVRKLVAFKRKSLRVKTTDLPEKFKMEWPKITLFGDSITRRSMDPDNGCWGSYIAYQVGSFLDVDARGFEGYNTEWALELMPKLFPKSYLDKVEIFVLFYGHNDSWEIGPWAVSPDKYETNLRSMIKYLNENGLENRKIVMITPTWFYQEALVESFKGSGLPTITKTLDHAKCYSDAVLRVAMDNEIDVLDFFDVSVKYEPLETLFCDGVHFSREGAKLLYKKLMPIIEKKLELSFEKPLADLWHVLPLDQRPEMKPFQSAIQAYQAKQAEAAKCKDTK